jgi:hypothetical protein
MPGWWSLIQTPLIHLLFGLPFLIYSVRFKPRSSQNGPSMGKVRSERAPSHHHGWLQRLPLWWALTTPNFATALSIPSDSTAFSPRPFDRFAPRCPADLDSVRKFDPSLVVVRCDDDDDDSSNTTTTGAREECYWVAVHRSSTPSRDDTTMPSSTNVRDEFWNAMRSSTDHPPPAAVMMNNAAAAENAGTSSDGDAAAPVAVARLYRPPNNNNDAANNNHFLLDCMRCVLKKEDSDANCEGSSEHAEALCVAIDTLLEYYLETLQPNQFEGAIRTKATLVAAPLLERRGFVPVHTLRPDMASHVSSLDQCLSSYAERAVATSSSSTVTPAARRRAINIVSRLSRIDRAADLQERQRLDAQNDSSSSSGNDDDDDDPWQGMRRFL